MEILNLAMLRLRFQEFQRAISLLATATEDVDHPVLIAGSPERKKLMQGLPLLGLSREPILIKGEPGVGKKLIARAIHGFSIAKNAPIEFIDARDISGSWIRETRRRIDQISTDINESTVNVIENIHKLSFSIQSQLLLLMENFNGNGLNRRQNRTSAPLIMLTCSDLESMAIKGLFRKDLYHRLSVLKLFVPPLKGHADDIRSLAEYFAAFYSINHNGGICRLPDEVLTRFVNYHWPGNVTELKRSIRKLLLTEKANWVTEVPRLCSYRIHGQGDQTDDFCVDVDDVRNFLNNNKDLSFKRAKNSYAAQVEKKLMKAALEKTNGNCKKAAGLLSISYKSMLNKVKEYQLV